MVSDARGPLHPVSTQVDSPELGRSCCNTALEDTGWGTAEGPPQLVNLLWGSSLASPHQLQPQRGWFSRTSSQHGQEVMNCRE